MLDKHIFELPQSVSLPTMVPVNRPFIDHTTKLDIFSFHRVEPVLSWTVFVLTFQVKVFSCFLAIEDVGLVTKLFVYFPHEIVEHGILVFKKFELDLLEEVPLVSTHEVIRLVSYS